MQPDGNGGPDSWSAYLPTWPDGAALHHTRVPVVGRGHRCTLPTSQFRAGDWTGDLLQDRALHTPILLLLLGHSCLLAGHIGCSHAHLEHFTPPRWLPRTSSYNHQPLTGVTFPPRSGQRLRGVTLLRHKTSQSKAIKGYWMTVTRLYSQLFPFNSSRAPAMWLSGEEDIPVVLQQLD